MLDHGCIFCNIVTGKAPSRNIYRDDQVTAFYDIHPVTPVHILVVPNKHFSSINESSELEEELLGHMLVVAKKLALQEGLQTVVTAW